MTWLRVEMVLVLAGLVIGLSSLSPSEARGQEGPFAFHVRGGITHSLAEFRQPDRGWEKAAGGGPSLTMGFTFPFYRALGLYVGFSQYRFDCDRLVCPEGQSWVSTGFDLAGRVVIGRGPLRLWLQGGLHTHRMEARLRADGPPINLRSEGGGGYEAGGGLLFRIGERTSLAPGIRYGLGNVPVDGRPTLGPRYLVFDIGLVLGF